MCPAGQVAIRIMPRCHTARRTQHGGAMWLWDMMQMTSCTAGTLCSSLDNAQFESVSFEIFIAIFVELLGNKVCNKIADLDIATFLVTLLYT